MILSMYIIYFLSMALWLSSLNYLFLPLFMLISFTSMIWFNNEKLNQSSFNKLSLTELSFIFFLISTLFLLLSGKVNMIWLVFMLEFQSFMILGSCYLFKGESLKVKEMEGSLNYIFPAFFSFMLILCYVLGVNMEYSSIYFNNTVFHIILMVSIFIKVGSFPTYSWVPNVFYGITYSALLFMAVMSKVFMMVVLLQYMEVYSLICMLGGFTSMLISSFMMMNQVSVKKFLAYSSMANMGWILLVLGMAKSELVYQLCMSEVLVLFFFIYAFNFMALCILLKHNYSKQIYNFFNLMKTEKQTTMSFFLIMTALLSMAGVPPFAGFLGKFMIFTYYYNYSLSLSLSLVFISSLFVFMYLSPLVSMYKVNLPYSSLLHQYTKSSLTTPTFNLFVSFLTMLNFMIMFTVFQSSF